MSAFKVSFSIRKEFKKKKINREIGFALICLFHVQGQEPKRSSSTTRACFLANFIITKYLTQEVDDDLCLCVDEPSSCGLSITGDKSIHHCHVIKK